MKDGLNRNINYIRISITDRCNLRCTYCMPKEGVPCIKHEEILTYEEIERLSYIFAGLGIHKIKITGGEPLVRKNVDILIKKLSMIHGIDSITLTTNGTLLSEQIHKLVEAGLTGVNISLDTMDSITYKKLTRKDMWSSTMEGIDSSLKYKDLTVKINCVPIRGVNEKEIVKIASLAKDKNLHVRFIEMMPIGLGKSYSYMKEEEVISILEEKFGELRFFDKQIGNGPAHYFTIDEFEGKVGFISARTHKFCNTCNRIRLTSDGYLKTCLQYHVGGDLKGMLRSGKSNSEIEKSILEILQAKPESHHFETHKINSGVENRNMVSIGG